MPEGILEQLDGVFAELKHGGWAPRRIDMTAGDRERVRVQVHADTGIWMKPDGLSTYREVPIAEARRTRVSAERDGVARNYDVPLKRPLKVA